MKINYVILNFYLGIVIFDKKILQMDKSWLNQPRFTTAYKDGVRDFL